MKITEALLANFTSSSDTRNFYRDFSRYLGITEQYRLARLAIGRSMNDGVVPDPAADARGNPLKGAVLFGAEEAEHLPWLAHICERLLQRSLPITLAALQSFVRDHWHRGCALLRADWETSGESYDRFIEILARSAALPDDLTQKDATFADTDKHSDLPNAKAITIKLGHRVDSGEAVAWTINGRGYSPNLAIMGQAGSGKTFAMLGFLAEVRRQSPIPVLLIDAAKDELADKPELDSLNLEVRKIPSQPMPLDIFHGCDISQDASRDAAVAFAESLDRALADTGLTANQKPRVVEALRPLLSKKTSVTLLDVQAALNAHYEAQGLKEDRVLSVMKTINFYKLTQPELSPADFFSSSWLLTFGRASEDTRRLTVFLLFDALDRYLKSLPEAPLDVDGNRAIRIILAIDEARPLLAARHAGLSNLVRTHRSKGLVVMLASQSPNDYDGQTDDFMQQIGLPVCFRTNSSASAALSNMFKSKKGVNFSSLQPGQCLTVVDNAMALLKTY